VVINTVGIQQYRGTITWTITGKMKDDLRYDALCNDENHSESSTEVEDSDTERAIKPRRQKKRKTFWVKVKAYRWVVDTALLLVILGLLVEKGWETHQSHEYEFTGDLTGFAPTCEYTDVSAVLSDRNADIVKSHNRSNRSIQILSLLLKTPQSSGVPRHSKHGSTSSQVRTTYPSHDCFPLI
jgi:hypothetical protein